MSNILPEKNLKLAHNTKYLSRNPLNRRLIGNFVHQLQELAGQVQPQRVLDIGCGEAIILRQLHPLWPDVTTIHAIDMRPKSLQLAPQIFDQADYLFADLYHPPLPNRYYDLVICTEVMEHLPDPETALQNISRLSRGYCLLSVPHEPWWRIANMARGRYWSGWGNTPGHLNHWSYQGYLNFVSQRMKVIDTRRPFPWTIILGQIL